MKKLKRQNANNKQIQISFDPPISDQGGVNFTKSPKSSSEFNYNHAKVIPIYSKSFLYKSILNRKME